MATESVLVPGGVDGLIEAAGEATGVVAGLSERWEREGLGGGSRHARARRAAARDVRASRAASGRYGSARGIDALHLIAHARLIAWGQRTHIWSYSGPKSGWCW